MLLIYHDEAYWEERTAAEMEPVRALVSAYIAELRAAGVLRGSSPLRSTSSATTVRRRDGKLKVSDGPFAETREQLGGYFIIDVPHLDDALRWASRWPNLDNSSVEIRPMSSLQDV